MKNGIRIGAGSAWWGERIEPAALNAERGDLDYLCFETIAKATVSAAQVRARRDPTFPGYDTYLDERMRAVLLGCLKRGTKIVTNQGWINPEGAAQRYTIDHLWMMNFVCQGALGGGVSRSLCLDNYGKTLSAGILAFELELPEALREVLRGM